MKTSIDQYCINVTDLERSVNFYQTVLGLEVTHRIETPQSTMDSPAVGTGRIPSTPKKEDRQLVEAPATANCERRDPAAVL